MKPRPDLASGPWPCYELSWPELGAVCEASGIGTEDQDGQPLMPADRDQAVAVIDGLIDGLRKPSHT